MSASCILPRTLPPTKKVSTKCDSCLVNITYVNSPGEFYVVRVSDKGKCERISSTLNADALSYSTPSQCIPGQVYAVCDNGGNWSRGRCVSKSGFVNFEDKKETLYDFYMLDQGRRENNIRSSTIRTLPSNIASYAAVAQKCTLNDNFQPVTWNVQTVNYFKKITRQGPMKMKIFRKQDNVFSVDLAQLPRFADEGIVSVRNSLLSLTRVPNLKFLKHMPKFPRFLGASDQHYRVRVSNALTPSLIYVHILDEHNERRQVFKEDMQQLVFAENDPDARVKKVRKGIFFLIIYLFTY